MPRKSYIAHPELPYHIWARTNNRDWFDLPMNQTWEIFSNHLYFLRNAYNVRILNFVLMSNHYHMNVWTPDANLAEAMNYFQGETSREIGRATGRINKVYGGPYGWSLLRGDHALRSSYKYVYRNPAEAKMVRWAEEYPYSTLNGLLGQRSLTIPVEPDRLLFPDVEGCLKWLNEPYANEDVRKALWWSLRRKQFKIAAKFKTYL